MPPNDVIVVGGGPAGIFAAIAARDAGARVILLERNEKLGKKLYITGKGRCNLTNTAEREAFLKAVVRNPRFLYASLAGMGSAALIERVEGYGVPLKVERGGRVFPESDRSGDVLRALERALRRSGAEVRLNARVEAVLSREGRAAGVRVGGEELRGDAVVLATGGASYPATGSTGDGYRFARAFGHGIRTPLPALSPIETAEAWPARLSGLSLKNVALCAKLPAGRFREQGELLFTHFGVSGPLALTLSSRLPEEPEGVGIAIDLKPALDEATLDQRLIRDLKEPSGKRIAAVLDGLAPRSLSRQIAELIGLDPSAPAATVTAKARRSLAEALKNLPLTVRRLRGLDEAIVTRGGVEVGGVNPSTLESKLAPSLYLAGELLDVDALTGGFNIQIACSTGYLAGKSAATRK